MSWTYDGRWIEDGRQGMYDPRNDPRYMMQQPRQPVPPSGYSYYNQPASAPMQPPMQPAPGGMTVTPEMVHVDIERVRGEQDVIDAIVPADGTSRMFMTADERMIGTKCMGPNGPDITFYYPQKYKPEPKLDPRDVVLRSELEPMLDRWYNSRMQAAPMQQTGPYPSQQAQTPMEAAPVQQTGNKKRAEG